MIEINIPQLDLPEAGDHSFAGVYPETDDYAFGGDAVLMKPHKTAEFFPAICKMYPGRRLAAKFYATYPLEKVAEITKIQNIFSWQGLAPRVFWVLKVNNYYVQIVEYVEGDPCYDDLVLEAYNENLVHPYIKNGGDLKAGNLIGNQWVDFGHYAFDEYLKYLEEVKRLYDRCATWGGHGAYQRNEDLGVMSGRGHAREMRFGLGEYDFSGKTVLDIGCSGGYFTNYCAKRGARAVGVDVKSVIPATREAANVVGVFNAEYYYVDAKSESFVEHIKVLTGIERFDYVFFLSMDQHVGFHDWLGDIADTLFFESNGGKPVAEEYELFKPELEQLFDVVEFHGTLAEGAERNLFVCSKGDAK